MDVYQYLVEELTGTLTLWAVDFFFSCHLNRGTFLGDYTIEWWRKSSSVVQTEETPSHSGGGQTCRLIPYVPRDEPGS